MLSSSLQGGRLTVGDLFGNSNPYADRDEARAYCEGNFAKSYVEGYTSWKARYSESMARTCTAFMIKRISSGMVATCKPTSEVLAEWYELGKKLAIAEASRGKVVIYGWSS